MGVDARLVVLSPPQSRGTVVPVAAPRVMIGRATDCDIVFDDPHVSRRHAEIDRGIGRVVVRDLGSLAGTSVNGIRLDGARAVRHGDLLSFGSVEVRYEELAAGDASATAVLPQAAAARTQPASVDFHVARQRGEVINNVGRDQFVDQRTQHIRHERESFLREIAATRSKARFMIWVGALLSVVGAGAWIAVIVSFIDGVPQPGTRADRKEPKLLGEDVFGVPAGALALAAAFVGAVLLVVGVVLHIVAAARRRRVDRELPLAA